jgi:Cu/Ag efflux protein CusF
MEKKQTELSMKYQNQLKKLIEMERMSISNSIKDKSVLKKFKNDKDVALLKCLENDAD